MFHFLALLAIAAVAYGDSNVLQNVDRIVGGSQADILDVPYQLSLRHDDQNFCGATLISASWAISSASCVVNADITASIIVAGTTWRNTGGQRRNIARIVVHPSYDSGTFDNDISLILLAAPLIFDETVQPASLPYQDEDIATGTYGLISGWGFQAEGAMAPVVLLQASVPVLDQTSCNIAYSGAITDNMLCAGFWEGGRSTCAGDIGGPFAIDGKLVGVISWSTGCGRPNFPGVYTRVAAYRDWITSNVGYLQ